MNAVAQDSYAQKQSLLMAARVSRCIIGGVVILVPSIFTWIYVSSWPIAEAISRIPASSMRSFALAIFFWSWILGVNNDIKEQELRYVSGPERSALRVMLEGSVFAVFMIVMFFALVYSASSRYWVWFVLGLWTIDCIGSLYLFLWPMRKCKEAAHANRLMNKDYASAIKIQFLWEYLFGWWKFVRAAYSLLIIAVMGVLEWTDAAAYLSSFQLPVSSDSYAPLVLLFWVVSTELWIWIGRFSLKSKCAVVDSISLKYVIERNPAPDTK